MIDRPSYVAHVDASRVRIAVRGDDRFTWLNGVLTCDLKPSIEDEGRTPRAFYGCALNVKGRLLGDVIVVVARGEVGAWIPRRAAETVLSFWRTYVIMEDCELDLDESRALVVVQGEKAPTPCNDEAPIDLFGIGGGFVVDVDRASADAEVERHRAAGASVLDEDGVRALKIETARATWGLDVDEHVYVQEAGLTERAVSFSKGCYLGQEVVCMLQMRGKVHRRMAQLAVDVPPSVGAEVKMGADVVGHVTSVAKHADGKATALAMLKSSAEVGAELDVGGAHARVTADVS